ncbi:uncharacterized protein LOC108143981 [Drosophila elegans]|uniref:uncharacterized protein LOC108143981 n=1 Tax=Drosophila elegans TaxID=30023 RepID=UPI0007E69FE6|nr:uncharacterized protein LOC108143981 [Drosophila elegans]
MNFSRVNRVNRSRDDEGIDMSSLNSGLTGKAKKLATNPHWLTVLKKLPPKPQKSNRLFQPTLKKKAIPVSLVVGRKGVQDVHDVHDGHNVHDVHDVQDIKDFQDAKVGMTVEEPLQGKELAKRLASKRNGVRNGRGGRILDRQSGSRRTGVKAVFKRNGGGAHNWGSPKQDIEMRNEIDWSPSFNKTKKSSKSLDMEDSMEKKELFTLDEWRAMRVGAQQKKKPPQEKGQENEDGAPGPGSSGTEATGRRCGRQQRLVDIKIIFYDKRLASSSKQGPTLKISQDPKYCPKVDDELQFPNLR